MVWISPLFAVALALAPTFVSAGIFPKGSLVKMIGPKEFKEAMKENVRRGVALVSCWYLTLPFAANNHCGVHSALVRGMSTLGKAVSLHSTNSTDSTVNAWLQSTRKLPSDCTL